MCLIIPTAVAQSFINSSPLSKDNSRERHPPRSKMPDFNETSEPTSHTHSVLMYLIIPTAVPQSFVNSSPRSKDNSRECHPRSYREEVYARRRGSPQKDRSLSPRPAIVYAPSVPSGHTSSESSTSPEKYRVRFDEGALEITFILFGFCPNHQ